MLGNKKHKFPGGVSSKDKVVRLASGPGGFMNAGGRANGRESGLLKSFPSAEPGALGAASADCHCKFNRKEGKVAYQKPEAPRKALEEIFDME